MAMSGAERQRKRWARRTPEQIAARKEMRRLYWLGYDQQRRQKRAERHRALYAAMTPGQKAVESVRGRSLRYNISEALLHEMLAAGCEYPESDHKGPLHIDHDHSCCPGSRSCGKCVRGVLCANHNLLLGKFEKMSQHLVWIVSYIARRREEDTK